ncbi:MAG: hypothetical protein ACM34E_09760 [Acidobacteriota bacterium]
MYETPDMYETADLMPTKVAIVAALKREVKPLIKSWTAVQREYSGRPYKFFESNHLVLVCAGIGSEAARRATEAVIAIYAPELIISAGFAGALDRSLRVGDSFVPRHIINAGDGSASETESGSGTLVSFGSIASPEQKAKLGTAYAAQAVDMEAAAVARAAHVHGTRFACVKAISDDQDFDMPHMERFVNDGQFSTSRFLAHSIAQPWLWPRVIRLAKNSARAARSLCKLLEQYNRNPEFLENVPAAVHLISKHKG